MVAPPIEGRADNRSVVGALQAWIRRLTVDPVRAEALCAAIDTADVDQSATVTAASLASIEQAGRQVSRHFTVMHHVEPMPIPDGDPAWPPPNLREIRQRAAGVSLIERSADGVGMVCLDTLDPLDVAEPFLHAAMAATVGCTELVLDLRRNGGGDPMTAAAVAGWILGARAPTPMLGIHGRHGVEFVDVIPPPPGHALRPTVAVTVVTGAATFSSAEMLAFHLQAAGRVTVVGQPTPGAADHVLPVVVSPHVAAHIPTVATFDAPTQRTWEGVGVLPQKIIDVAAFSSWSARNPATSTI